MFKYTEEETDITTMESFDMELAANGQGRKKMVMGW